MKLSIQINFFIEQIEKLKLDIEQFKKQIELLEHKNQQLSDYLKKDKKSKSVENLFKLYEQGFHICNESFGQIRDEDCLFCIDTISRVELNNE